MTLHFALSVLACGGNDDPPVFPHQLAPLEEVNLAPAVDPVGGDAFPEVISLASGEGEDVFWAHARAYVKADAVTVWDAFREVDVVVDRREVDEWTSERDVDPGFDDSVVIHNTVHDLITVNYDITWVHELQEGTPDAVALAMAQWENSNSGPFIDILRGSAVIRQVEPGVTEVELIEHLKAAARDEQTIASYLQDLYDSVVAQTHGEALPTYE